MVPWGLKFKIDEEVEKMFGTPSLNTEWLKSLSKHDFIKNICHELDFMGVRQYGDEVTKQYAYEYVSQSVDGWAMKYLQHSFSNAY